MYPKGKLPFRVGTTSYIIPDGLEGNLCYLANKVDEMQLVLFNTEEYSNIPTAREAKRLAQIAADADVQLTVHLPGSIDLGGEDTLRRRSFELFARSIGSTLALEPITWVFHAFVPSIFGMSPHMLPRREERIVEALQALLPLLPSPRNLSIENIHPHFFIEPPIIHALGTSVCVDIGHLIQNRESIWPRLRLWKGRMGAVHLHGSDGREDHKSLDSLPRELLFQVLEALSQVKPPTVTIEVFGEDDFESSMALLTDWQEKRLCAGSSPLQV